ncbi:protein YgfX [Microbulbifer sp. ZKSA006]|uniref:protein YgfX n=1 Tax=Microbulbifer sp. ZKSA006 TaxID=3243390 RepID=UPI004039D4DC
MTTPDSRNSPALLLYERSARLNCAVAPSSLLLLLLLLIAALAVLLIWLCNLPPPLSVLASLLVVIYAWIELRRLKAVRGHLSTRERRWFWRADGLENREFHFAGELVLWSWLMVINARDRAGRRLRLVLARDMLAPQDWRRLQVALRYSR